MFGFRPRMSVFIPTITAGVRNMAGTYGFVVMNSEPKAQRTSRADKTAPKLIPRFSKTEECSRSYSAILSIRSAAPGKVFS